ncbi:MAG TPA: hypothetical protein VFW52_00475 [Candidatus Saccharimonadales bacterium]|nr:hypothetical protein [Candidatus Saccharimonadales bacterium]
MKLLLTGLKFAAAVAALTVLGLVVTAHGSKAVAQGNDNKPQQSNNQPSVVYTYTAQSGDSYTKMARKAVQTYGLTEKVNLTQAGIIYAETNLTRSAGSPELMQGQKVEIKQSDVKAWADKAKNLSDAQQAAWNYYVPFVNFNTNNVGE